MRHLSMLVGLAVSAACLGDPETSTLQSQILLDTQTGIGFAGKGRVQSAFKWNDEGLQTNVDGITFYFELRATFQQSCMHRTHSDKMIVRKTFVKTVHLDATVDHDPRRNPLDKVNGFLLHGIRGTDGVPKDLCNPGQSEPDWVWLPDPEGEYPELTETWSERGILYVRHDGVSHPLWRDDGDGVL